MTRRPKPSPPGMRSGPGLSSHGPLSPREARRWAGLGVGVGILVAIVFATGVYQLAEFIAHTWPEFHP